MTVCSHLFVKLGETERRALGMPELPMAIAPHPIGGLKAQAVQDKADALLEQLVASVDAVVVGLGD